MKKKKIIFLIMLLVVSLTTEAQTYSYRYQFTVDPATGNKRYKEISGNGIITLHYTFSADKETCYRSDQNGEYKYSIGGNKMIYFFSGYINGMRQYVQSGSNKIKLYFSDDLKRMNEPCWYANDGEIDVYQYIEVSDIPDRLY